MVREDRGELSGEEQDKLDDGGLCFGRIMARFNDRILELRRWVFPALSDGERLRPAAWLTN